MPEDTLNASNPETANHHWFPFLRFKKECEAAGKEVSVNEWMRETGQNIEREPLDERFDPCGNHIPNYQFILNKCRSYFPQIQHYGRFIDNKQTIQISNMHRLILHLQFVNRNNQARVNSTEMYYRNLRARYLLNRIDKGEFKKKIQMHDKSVKKDTGICVGTR